MLASNFCIIHSLANHFNTSEFSYKKPEKLGISRQAVFTHFQFCLTNVNAKDETYINPKTLYQSNTSLKLSLHDENAIR